MPQTAYPEKRQVHPTMPGAQAATSSGGASVAQPPVPQPEGSEPGAQLPEGQQLTRRIQALEPGSVVKDPPAVQPVSSLNRTCSSTDRGRPM